MVGSWKLSRILRLIGERVLFWWNGEEKKQIDENERRDSRDLKPQQRQYWGVGGAESDGGGPGPGPRPVLLAAFAGHGPWEWVLVDE